MTTTCPMISENLLCARELPDLAILLASKTSCLASALGQTNMRYGCSSLLFTSAYQQKFVDARERRVELTQRLEENCENYHQNCEVLEGGNTAGLKAIYKDLYEIYDNSNYILRVVNNFLGKSGLLGATKSFVPVSEEDCAAQTGFPAMELSDNEFFMRGNNILLGHGQQIFLNLLNIYSLYQTALTNILAGKPLNSTAWQNFATGSATGDTLWSCYHEFITIQLEYSQREAFSSSPHRCGLYYHRRVLLGAAAALNSALDFIEQRA